MESSASGDSGRMACRWDPCYNEEGAKALFENSQLHSQLISHLSELTSQLELNDQFIEMITLRDVVSEDELNNIKAKKTPPGRALFLINLLLEKEVYKFHGFIWALVNSRQHNLVELLGLSPRCYFDIQIFLDNSCLVCPSCHVLFSSASYLLSGCGHHICRPCVKGANFTLKDDKKEEVKCPVCGVISLATPSGEDGDLGLDVDEAFQELCQLVSQRLDVKNDCESCKRSMGDDTPMHLTAPNGNFLCADCFLTLTSSDEKMDVSMNEAAQDETKTKIIHCHQSTRCCLHDQEETVEFYHDTKIYKCELCSEDWAGNILEEEETDLEWFGTDMESMQENLVELKDQHATVAADLLDYRKLFAEQRQSLEAVIEWQRKRVKQWIDVWAAKKLDELDKIELEVERNYQHSAHWKKLADDVSFLLDFQPWSLMTGDIMSLLCDKGPDEMDVENDNLQEDLQYKCAIPDILKLPPTLRCPPSKAQLLWEWPLPALAVGEVPSIAWLPSGDLLVLIQEKLWTLEMDAAKSSWTASVLGPIQGATQINSAPDGIWAVTFWGRSVIQEHRHNSDSGIQWELVDMSPDLIAIDRDLTFAVRKPVGNSRGRIMKYDSMIETHSERPYIYYQPTDIHHSPNNNIVLTSAEENKIYIYDGSLKLKKTIGDEGDLAAPSGVTSVFTGEFLLVSDTNNDRVLVYSGEGQYVSQLDIQGVVKAPSSLQCLDRRAKDPLLAMCVCIDNKLLLRIFSII